MSKELIKQLRDLANCRHDDFTVGYEAADRIEQLEADVAALNKATDIAIEINNDQVGQIEKLEKELAVSYEDVAELKSKLDEAVNAVHRLSNGQPFDAIVISDTVKRRTAQIEQENDQLREQVKVLRDVLQFYMDNGICEPLYYKAKKALAATEPKE